MEKHTFSDDDRLYLQMMQDNITRMAINSTNCKSWMVMLMSGFLALGCSINDYNFKPLSMNSISHEQEIQGFVITNNRWYTSSIIPLYGGTIMIIIVLTVIINFDSILKLLNIH